MIVSIVTPSYNSGRHIRETILSVITQAGDFYIEYIVVDNCSTDGTKDIVEQFVQIVNSSLFPLSCRGVSLKFVCEKDDGMYDAISKGFKHATGDIYAWLNADDIYLPGALATITRTFRKYNDIHWIKGITSYMTQDSSIWKMGKCFLYNQNWIRSGMYGRKLYFIQQDSVFWRSWLWKKSGGVNTKLKLAGDYDLWVKFAELTPLITVCTFLSCFRKTEGQISQDLDAYWKEIESRLSVSVWLAAKARLYYRFEFIIPRILRGILYRILFGRITYELIKIQEDGTMHRDSGQYYSILAKP